MSEFPVEVPVEEVPVEEGDKIILKERTAGDLWQKVDALGMNVKTIVLSERTMMMWTRDPHDPDVYVSYSAVFPKMIILYYNIKSLLLTVESPKGRFHEIDMTE